MTRSRWFVMIGVTALAWSQAACIPGGPSPSAAAGNSSATLRAQRSAAAGELQAWDKAAAVADGTRFVPTGNGTGIVGAWEPSLAANAQRALAASYLITTAHLSDQPPKAGVVRWSNGTSRTVQLVSAADAMAQFGTLQLLSSGCGSCQALEVTGARLGHVTVATTRGDAEAPAWEFTIRHSAVRVTRLAVATPDGIAVAATRGPQSPGWIAVKAAGADTTSQRLTVGFTGRASPASKRCGADYSATAVESGSAVVVIVTEKAHGSTASCPAPGAARTASLRLDAPLGERTVLDVVSGLPVVMASG